MYWNYTKNSDGKTSTYGLIETWDVLKSDKWRLDERC